MCVQYVTKPSLNPAVLTSIKIFIEENKQALLSPRLLLQRPTAMVIFTCQLTEFFLKLNTNKDTLILV